jgi:hypothetical protein
MKREQFVKVVEETLDSSPQEFRIKSLQKGDLSISLSRSLTDLLSQTPCREEGKYGTAQPREGQSLSQEFTDRLASLLVGA